MLILNHRSSPAGLTFTHKWGASHGLCVALTRQTHLPQIAWSVPRTWMTLGRGEPRARH